MHRPPMPDPRELLRGARRVVILEDIVDHTNVGAIFRSVAGLGADAVFVTPRCADPLYRRSVRVSMGTVLQVPWTRLPEWHEAQAILHEAGFHIAAFALADNAVSLDDFTAAPPERVALLMGAEGDGVSRRAVAAADSIGFPLLVKGNIGGAGAGIARYDTREELRAAIADASVPTSIDGVRLVQEYVPARGRR